MQVDKDIILQLSKDKSKKSESGKDNINIRANMYPFSKEYLSYIETLTTYEIAAIILDNQEWIKSRKIKETTYSYHRGDIIMVNLGATNYGYELAYYHPVIVWENLTTSVLVIPCTSTPKKDNPYIVIADENHGFKNKTTIMLDKVRMIDKRRIKGNKKGGIVGKLSKNKIEEIRDLLLSSYFSETVKYIESLKNKLATEEENYKNLNIQFNDLKLENENLNEKVKKLEKELKELTEK